MFTIDIVLGRPPPDPLPWRPPPPAGGCPLNGNTYIYIYIYIYTYTRPARRSRRYRRPPRPAAAAAPAQAEPQAAPPNTTARPPETVVSKPGCWRKNGMVLKRQFGGRAAGGFAYPAQRCVLLPAQDPAGAHQEQPSDRPTQPAVPAEALRALGVRRARRGCWRGGRKVPKGCSCRRCGGASPVQKLIDAVYPQNTRPLF